MLMSEHVLNFRYFLSIQLSVRIAMTHLRNVQVFIVYHGDMFVMGFGIVLVEQKKTQLTVMIPIA